MELFIVAWKYFRFLLKADASLQSDEALAGYCLRSKPGFRFPGSYAKDRLLVLKCWLRMLRACMNFSGPVYYTFYEGLEGTAIFDHKSSVKDIRVKQLKNNSGFAPRYAIARHDLRSRSFSRFFGFIALTPLLLPWALWRGFTPENRINAALLFLEIFEAHALLEWMKKKKIRKLFFYSPFEVDANALYLLLREQGVEVLKVPSPNLLATHNKLLLSDGLVLSSPYQLDELNAYSDTIRVKYTEHWKPEQYDGYAHVYENSSLKPEALTMGFYSHASWVRESSDDNDTGLGDHESELLLKKLLGTYFSDRPDIKLTVFLHPRERRHPDFSKVLAHYDGLFGTGRYSFAPLGSPSSHLFNTVDVGLGAISTILFERLFMGYKTIFFPSHMKMFPLAESKIKMICPVNEAELIIALDLALNTATEKYFKETGLIRYTRYSW